MSCDRNSQVRKNGYYALIGKRLTKNDAPGRGPLFPDGVFFISRHSADTKSTSQIPNIEMKIPCILGEFTASSCRFRLTRKPPSRRMIRIALLNYQIATLFPAHRRGYAEFSTLFPGGGRGISDVRHFGKPAIPSRISTTSPKKAPRGPLENKGAELGEF